MVPGKRYLGYGMINNYRQFMFTPAQTGSRQGAIKYIYQSEDVTISETKNLLQLRFSIQKSSYKSPLSLVRNLLYLFEKATKIIKDYEI